MAAPSLAGLDRILPAMLHQRAADEDDRREPVDQAELADRVGDIDVGRLRPATRRASAARLAARRHAAISAMPGPRSGWRGAMSVSSRGIRSRSLRCASITVVFFARMGRGGGDHRAVADRRAQLRELVGSAGGAGTSSLRLPVVTTRGAPSSRSARRRRRLRARQRSKRSQQRADRARHTPPAPERALRQPAVDQDQRDAALGARHDQVRPQIGFDEQREVGLPVVEEARDEARRVERHELMDHAGRQPLRGELRGGDRAGRHQHGDLARADALDQREDADEFADAGAVQPDQRAVRPLEAGLAAPLRAAAGDLPCRAAAASRRRAARSARAEPSTAAGRSARSSGVRSATAPAPSASASARAVASLSAALDLLPRGLERVVVGIGGTRIGSPATHAMRPNGRLITAAVPVLELDAAAGGDRDRIDRPAGQLAPA